MIWILLSLSTGYYNSGNISGIEFNTQENCIEAMEQVKKQDKVNAALMCVKKGKAAK
ncbi:hypothetical protein G7090_16455 [Leclercia sp. 29361]|uniref:hypothetical protein n=1 Tax=Leclercia sp. 29361 TaxID=2714951 RepID=UPI00140E3C7A|nr:hypothetical protein [Leclercia sp. 29361]QIK14876.1 hypothetical protein G7090_16455 [Leclercia sp. 29361]